MADMEFSRDDIDSLIEKISTLQPDFNDQERSLLMSIFALAAEHALPTAVGTAMLPEAVAPGQATSGSGPATADELKQQLLRAYIPGSSFDSITESSDEFAPHDANSVPVSHSIHRHSSIHR
jgi:hypothetical protein